MDVYKFTPEDLGELNHENSVWNRKVASIRGSRDFQALSRSRERDNIVPIIAKKEEYMQLQGNVTYRSFESADVAQVSITSYRMPYVLGQYQPIVTSFEESFGAIKYETRLVVQRFFNQNPTLFYKDVYLSGYYGTDSVETLYLVRYNFSTRTLSECLQFHEKSHSLRKYALSRIPILIPDIGIVLSKTLKNFFPLAKLVVYPLVCSDEGIFKQFIGKKILSDKQVKLQRVMFNIQWLEAIMQVMKMDVYPGQCAEKAMTTFLSWNAELDTEEAQTVFSSAWTIGDLWQFCQKNKVSLSFDYHKVQTTFILSMGPMNLHAHVVFNPFWVPSAKSMAIDSGSFSLVLFSGKSEKKQWKPKKEWKNADFRNMDGTPVYVYNQMPPLPKQNRERSGATVQQMTMFNKMNQTLAAMNKKLTAANNNVAPTYREVKRMYAEGNDADLNALVDAKSHGKHEMDLLLQQVGVKTMTQLEKNWHTMSPTDQTKHIKMAIIDDFGFGALAMGALKHLSSYAPQLLSHLANKTSIGRKIQGKVGRLVDGMYSAKILQPSSAYDLDAINLDYIICFLKPTLQAIRRPNFQPIKTALIKGSMVYDVTTNAAGQAQLVIFPEMPQGSGGAEINTFMRCVNHTSLNLSTGAYTAGTATLIPGPLSTQTANMESYMISSFEVQIMPVASAMANGGTVQAVYWGQPINPTAIPSSALVVIGNANFPQMPFYQIADMKSNGIRMTRLPSIDDTAQIYTGVQPAISGWNEGFVINVQGGTANTLALTVQVSFVYEFIPVPAALFMSPVESAGPGVATVQCLQNMFTQFPNLQSCSSSTAEKIITCLRVDEPKTHNGVLKCVSSAMMQHQSSNNYQEILPTGRNLQDDAEDMDGFDINSIDTDYMS